jgi:uncharacterized protein
MECCSILEMKKEEYLIGVVVIAVVLIVGVFFLGVGKKKVCFGEDCFKVEVADTPEERAVGLMHRSELLTDSGMLFVFEREGRYDFWMKNTRIPLDIIWVSKDLKVVDWASAEPCEILQCPYYMPEADALYVVEINAGLIEERGISLGDSVKIS